MIVELTHAGGMAFRAKAGAYEVLLDAKPPIGKGGGPNPKEMLIASVLGCTAMDVVGLVKKFKMTPDEFALKGEAVPRDEHPKIFPRMDIIYSFKGQGLDPAKIQEAVDLSMNKYCGITAMLVQATPIYYSIEINGEITGKGQAKF